MDPDPAFWVDPACALVDKIVNNRGANLEPESIETLAGRYFYRRENPADDAESARLTKASQQTFADAAALLDTPARAVRIPYEDTTLPGYGNQLPAEPDQVPRNFNFVSAD